MKQFKWQIILVMGATAAFFAFSRVIQVEVPTEGFSTIGSDTVRAEVTEIIEEGEIDLGGHLQNYQLARVNILEGKYAGIIMEIDYGKYQVRSDDYVLKVGDKVMVAISKTPQNVVTAYFVDFLRSGPIFWLAITGALAIILISGWKGVRSLLSMAFSLYVIINYIIPHILIGEDPLRVSIIGSGILLGVTLYLTYGWNLKSHSAVVSMILVLLLTGALSGLFVVLAKLNGTGEESVLFLMQSMETPINLRGLLVGGMIIGALGVLDDLVTTQSSAVFELRHANPDYGFLQLYNSAMRIGQDHVAATVNTLVLAYAGASLPMLLLFSLAGGDLEYLINFSFIAEEIIRTLVGSLGLIAAVPLTTLIAIFFVKKTDSLGRWRQILGPEGSAVGHYH
jgi:uncharacterized membrane protein